MGIHWILLGATAMRIPLVYLVPVLVLAIAAGAQQSEVKEAPGLQRAREEWFYSQRAWPLGHIPAGARAHSIRKLDRAIAAQAAAASRRPMRVNSASTADGSGGAPANSGSPAPASGAAWQPIGPWPAVAEFYGQPDVSGRVAALAVDPNNADIVYAGAAQGGVWKSTDGGTNWVPLTDHEPSLAVGSIAIDPTNSQVIYVGTGEETISSDSYYGAGVLKSIDGGRTWTQLGQAWFVGPNIGSFSSYKIGGAHIGSIAVDPGNNQVLLAGVMISDAPLASNSGIYRSTDGGVNWTIVQSGGPVTDVLFDPSSNGAVAYASMSYASSNTPNGVYKSTDAGATWTRLSSVDTAIASLDPNVSPGSKIGRTEIALAPSAPNTIYASLANAGTGGSSLLAFLVSTDGGQSWTLRSNTPDYCTPQCWYNHVIRVAPNDANVVYAGGIGLDRSTDAGVSWSYITSGGTAELHSDMHAIAFAAGKVYVGNDGGVWSSTDITASTVNWTNLNHTLDTIQIYPGMATFRGDPSRAIAGTQDNGTELYSGAFAWSQVTCGDGGWSAIDSTGTVYYTTCNNVNVQKSTNSGGLWSAEDLGLKPAHEAFIPPFIMDPSNDQILYWGGDKVFQSTNGAGGWTAISASLPTDYTALAVAPSDSNTVYGGTFSGQMHVTNTALQGANAAWTDRTAGLPGRTVTSIAVDEKDPQIALVGLSGFTVGSNPPGHVFRTTNGGASWTNVTGTLEDINTPVNDVVIDPDFSGVYYAGTDVGVFRTTDGGAHWEPLMTGLPRVAVLSLKLHRASRILRAGTHGRGAWDLLVGPVASVSSSALTFAGQKLNTASTAQTVNLYNSGNLPMTIGGISVSGDFAQSNNCGTTLAALAMCTVTVTFTPTASGARSGSLTISGNMPGGGTTVALSGTGIVPLALSLPGDTSVTAAFGNVIELASTTLRLTVTNNGTSTIHISAISQPGGSFWQSNNCVGSVGTGASCTVAITVRPLSLSSESSSFNISDDAGSGTQTVHVSATGVDLVLALAGISRPPRQTTTTTTTTNMAPATNNGTPASSGSLALTPEISITPVFAIMPAAQDEQPAEEDCGSGTAATDGERAKGRLHRGGQPHPPCKKAEQRPSPRSPHDRVH